MSGELNIQKFVLVEKFNLSSDEQQKLVDPIDNSVTAVDMDQVEEFQTSPTSKAHNTPGYFVFSTAPFNTEDGEAKVVLDLTPTMNDIIGDRIAYAGVGGRQNVKLPMRCPEPNRQANFQAAITAIAKDLVQASKHGTPELVIAIHGYSTEQTNVRRWYKKIFQYVNDKFPLKQKKNLVFIGYRWSSERVSLDKESLLIALKALPLLPLFLLIGGALGGLIFLIWANLAVGQWATLTATILLFLATAIASIIISLVLLRVIVYFRDSYRASNFAVPDLVELIRQLDVELDGKLPKLEGSKGRVNLSFIGHSMGGFVATNVIRILSDVFDPKAIDKRPTSAVGQAFSLERLVLASPDIPVLAIASNRANFLASSLRRFNEAYLFSNEGDLALRLASTAANYFSFPARTRESGYRLGNVTVSPGEQLSGEGSGENQYGIVNLPNLKSSGLSQSSASSNADIQFKSLTQPGIATALDSLVVSNINGSKPGTIAQLAKDRGLHSDGPTIADLFTYFDCTDYIETKNGNELSFNAFLEANKKYGKFIRQFKALGSKFQAVGILSRAIGVRINPKPYHLNLWNYIGLARDFLKGRDVHGGYFAAPFSQKLIYQLAFMGFHELSASYHTDPDQALELLHQDCTTHWLQVLLSPVHYRSAYMQVDEMEAIKQQVVEQISESAQPQTEEQL